ncbi:MAG TPA: NBR1-Ig-like domain-containing protein [Anaerolineales bacterium]|nr:NBR1-Ig-like domain-containing protein [Anaerolineales bacterium]
MNRSPKRILLATLAVVLLFAACTPVEPTQDPRDIEDQIATAVALTVAAQNTQTAAAIPAATNTTLPTQTESVPPTPTLVLPTATPLALPTVTPVPGGGSGGVTIRPEYACDIIRRRPFDNEIFRPNDTFEIKWTIINTGTKTMRGGLDLKFHDGELLTNISRVELPEMKPGDQYAVAFDGFAPKKEGHHVMVFIVEGGLCYPYTAIKVEK